MCLSVERLPSSVGDASDARLFRSPRGSGSALRCELRDRLQIERKKPHAGHRTRARHRIEYIRLDRYEAERSVQRLRLCHRWKRIETDSAVSDLTRLLADSRDEPPSELCAARSRTHVQALHLAVPVIDGAQRDAAHSLRAAPCEQQSSCRS